MEEPSGKRSKRGATSELNHDNWDQVIAFNFYLIYPFLCAVTKRNGGDEREIYVFCPNLRDFQDDDEVEVAGEFVQASKEELSTRVIKKAKRRGAGAQNVSFLTSYFCTYIIYIHIFRTIRLDCQTKICQYVICSEHAFSDESSADMKCT